MTCDVIYEGVGMQWMISMEWAAWWDIAGSAEGGVGL
jgi:hypothetical protein